MSFSPDWGNSQMGGICKNLPVNITMYSKLTIYSIKNKTKHGLSKDLLAMPDVIGTKILSANIGL